MKALITLFLLSVVTILSAQQNAHVHGQGKVLIAQDGSDWQLQFMFPAADVLGFEHLPETTAQKEAVENLGKMLDEVSNLVKVDGSCEIKTVDVSVPDMFTDFSMVGEPEAKPDKHSHDHDSHDHDSHDHDSHDHDAHDHDSHDHDSHDHDSHDHDSHDHDAHDHDAHDHDSHKHAHKHEHDHDHGDKVVHKDIEVSYVMSCKDGVNTMSISAFDTFPSLEKVEANWILTSAQGAKMLSPGDNRIDLN